MKPATPSRTADTSRFVHTIGQKFTLATCTAEVTRLEPGGRGIELEFHGSQWWFPYRAWFTEPEALALTAARP